MQLDVRSARITIRAFDNLGALKYANWFTNAGYKSVLKETATAELVEAALALQVLTDSRTNLAFLGDTQAFADWMGLMLIFD